MSGGTAEFIAAYVDNVNVSGGASIINAPSKYKDVYLLGGSDISQLNYEANK